MLNSPPQRLAREQVTELVHRVASLNAEAERCAAAECWTGAAVLIGATAEAMLLVAVCVFEADLRQRGLWRSKRSPSEWTLGQLIGVAQKAQWLPSHRSDDGSVVGALGGDIGNAVDFLKGVRTMATHPGAWARVGPDERPDFSSEKDMRPTYEVMCAITAEIRQRTHEVLLAPPPRAHPPG